MRDFDSFIYVSRYLTIHDIMSCSLVCKKFNEVFNYSLIWKELIARDFDKHQKSMTYKNDYINLFYIYHTVCNGQHKTHSLDCPPFVVTNMMLHEWEMDGIMIQGLIVSYDEPVVHVFKLTTLKDRVSDKCTKLHVFNRFGGGVWALTALKHILCLGSTDRSIHVVDIVSGQYLCALTGHQGTIRCLQAKIINHNWVLVSGSRDKSIKIWDLDRIVQENKSDAQRRSSVINQNFSSPSTSPRVSASDKYCLHTLIRHSDSVRSLSCTNDFIVSASYDRSACIWNYKGELIHELIGHSDKVYAVTCDNDHIWTGSLDNTIRIWDLRTGQCIYVLDHHSSLVGIVDQSNRYIVSASADSTVGVYPKDFQILQSRMEAQRHIRRAYGMYSISPFKSIPINNVYLPHKLNQHTAQTLMFGNTFRHFTPETPIDFPILHHINVNLTAITCMAHNTHFLVVGCDGVIKLYNIQTGEFIRDLVTGITNVWRVKITDRHIIVALSRNQKSEILALDFYVSRGFPVGMNTLFRTQSINNMDDSSDEE